MKSAPTSLALDNRGADRSKSEQKFLSNWETRWLIRKKIKWRCKIWWQQSSSVVGGCCWAQHTLSAPLHTASLHMATHTHVHRPFPHTKHILTPFYISTEPHTLHTALHHCTLPNFLYTSPPHTFIIYETLHQLHTHSQIHPICLLCLDKQTKGWASSQD
jgi:hypothetical protein